MKNCNHSFILTICISACSWRSISRETLDIALGSIVRISPCFPLVSKKSNSKILLYNFKICFKVVSDMQKKDRIKLTELHSYLVFYMLLTFLSAGVSHCVYHTMEYMFCMSVYSSVFKFPLWEQSKLCRS